ncbi:hypothetical protein SBA7_550015 [Candidatus Sulfotelmatobacter sp. SbA7]|nr:hypothetical protein SBA7_550015 [Candidatus Sulfotelmatobacter sp. SbA7]
MPTAHYLRDLVRPRYSRNPQLNEPSETVRAPSASQHTAGEENATLCASTAPYRCSWLRSTERSTL